MIINNRYFYKLRNSFVLFILVLLQGCANLYANKAKIDTDTIISSTEEITIQYRYTTKMITTIFSEEARYKLPEKYKNIKFVESDEVSENGYFVDITIKEDFKYNDEVSDSLKVSRWTLFLIPYFSSYDSIIYYDLYSEGVLIKRYTYYADNNLVIWSPLIYVFWVSFIHNNFQNVMDNIAFQFVHDINIEKQLVKIN